MMIPDELYWSASKLGPPSLERVEQLREAAAKWEAFCELHGLSESSLYARRRTIAERNSARVRFVLPISSYGCLDPLCWASSFPCSPDGFCCAAQQELIEHHGGTPGRPRENSRTF